MEIVATTSLPAVDRQNADRWNAASSCQKIADERKSKPCDFGPMLLKGILNDRKKAGAALCQAQVKQEGIAEVVVKDRSCSWVVGELESYANLN